MGSTKSHPTLNARTRSPRLAYASINAVAIVVFPTPECVPATTTTFIARDRSRALELATSRPRARRRALRARSSASRALPLVRARARARVRARALAPRARPRRRARVAPCRAGADGSRDQRVGRSRRSVGRRDRRRVGRFARLYTRARRVFSRCKTHRERSVAAAQGRACDGARDTRRRDDERAHAHDARVEGDD